LQSAFLSDLKAACAHANNRLVLGELFVRYSLEWEKAYKSYVSLLQQGVIILERCMEINATLKELVMQRDVMLMLRAPMDRLVTMQILLLLCCFSHCFKNQREYVASFGAMESATANNLYSDLPLLHQAYNSLLLLELEMQQSMKVVDSNVKIALFRKNSAPVVHAATHAFKVSDKQTNKRTNKQTNKQTTNNSKIVFYFIVL
jgi:hypothetical protein